MIGAMLAAALVSLTPYQRHQWFEGPDHPAMSACHRELAWGACQLPAGVSQAQAETLLDGKATAWRREGAELLVVARRHTDQAYLCCAPRGRMEHMGGDLWAIRARIVDFDQGLIEAQAVPQAELDPALYRGPAAPAKPMAAKTLQGHVIDAAIKSRYLGESRRITIYTPPGFDPARRYPVIYMADGVFRRDDFPIIEPLILDGSIPPVVVVAVWPGIEAHDTELRSKEYLLGWPTNAGRFARSESFLLDEVMPLAETRYGASDKPGDRLITGYSSGAAWAVSMAVRNPKVFGQAAAFSLGWPGAEKGVDTPGRPRLFLSAGSLEPTYYKATLALAERARRSGDEVVLRRLVSGHDDNAWRPMLVEALKWAFARRTAV
jgi:enterochelin esterase-like enzyme